MQEIKGNFHLLNTNGIEKEELNKMNKKKIFLRTLGFEETLISKYKLIVINISEISGHIFDKSTLKKALDAVVDLQPNLRINIDINSSPNRFFKVSNPYVDPIIIESDNPNSWEEIVSERMNMLFTYGIDESLFRFVLVHIKNTDKAFFLIELDHSISDGTSGMILLNDILNFYIKFLEDEMNACLVENYLEENHTNENSNEKEYANNYINNLDRNIKENSNKIQSLQLLPEIEKLSFPNGISANEKKKILEIKKKKEKEGIDQGNICTLKKFNTIPEESELIKGEKYFKNYALFCNGKESNFVNLKKFCKDNQFTIGALLMAACYFQIGKFLYEENLQNKDTIRISYNIDINLRKRFEEKLPNENVALLISVSELVIEFNKNIKFIDLCKIVFERLEDILKEKLFFYETEANKLILETMENSINENNDKENINIDNIKNEKNDFNINENEEYKKENQREYSIFDPNLNFSNIGAYPFKSIYKFNSKDLFKVKSLNCVGAPWAPTFSQYVFLIQSVDYMNYSFVYYGKENKKKAKEFFDGVICLIENSFKIQDSSFKEYLENKILFK